MCRFWKILVTPVVFVLLRKHFRRHDNGRKTRMTALSSAPCQSVGACLGQASVLSPNWSSESLPNKQLLWSTISHKNLKSLPQNVPGYFSRIIEHNVLSALCWCTYTAKSSHISTTCWTLNACTKAIRLVFAVDVSEVTLWASFGHDKQEPLKPQWELHTVSLFFLLSTWVFVPLFESSFTWHILGLVVKKPIADCCDSSSLPELIRFRSNSWSAVIVLAVSDHSARAAAVIQWSLQTVHSKGFLLAGETTAGSTESKNQVVASLVQ